MVSLPKALAADLALALAPTPIPSTPIPSTPSTRTPFAAIPEYLQPCADAHIELGPNPTEAPQPTWVPMVAGYLLMGSLIACTFLL
ncbi:MAG TPA: hypothetical protein PLJ12_06445 [Planctomycetota bacterium]|nr:hypothetical protein [Planctomycetota bacterium]